MRCADSLDIFKTQVFEAQFGNTRDCFISACNCYFISLMYFVRSLISFAVNAPSNGGIWFLPFATTLASVAGGILSSAESLKLLARRLLPTSEARPVGSWHPSQLVL